MYSVTDANANLCVLGAHVMYVKDVASVNDVHDTGVLDARIMYVFDVDNAEGVDVTPRR